MYSGEVFRLFLGQCIPEKCSDYFWDSVFRRSVQIIFGTVYSGEVFLDSQIFSLETWREYFQVKRAVIILLHYLQTPINRQWKISKHANKKEIKNAFSFYCVRRYTTYFNP